MADVAGVEPGALVGLGRIGNEHTLGLRLVTPIALHHQLAAHQYFAIVGDAHFGVHQRRANSVHLDPGGRAVAADHRPRLGLAIALKQGQADRVEEDADFGIERCAARHQRLHPAAEAFLDLGPEQFVEDDVDRPVEHPHAALIILFADAQRLTQHPVGELALFFDRFDHPRTDHLEQARHDDHDRRARLLDIRDELFEAFAVINLRADHDRQELAARMFIGVTEREEGQENLFVADTEVVDENFRSACRIVQDRAMMLHHPAWRAPGAAGIDKAGGVVAGHRGSACVSFIQMRLTARNERIPVVDRHVALLTDTQIFHADDDMRVRAHHRGHQRPGQLRGRNDHRAGAAIVEDMLVVAFGVGRIGRDGDAARGHDAKVGDAPFGTVFADQHHPVAILQPKCAQMMRERRDLMRDLSPAQRLPRAIGLAPQKRIVAAPFGAVEEHRDQAGEMVEMRVFQFHFSSLPGEVGLLCFSWSYSSPAAARHPPTKCRDHADRRRRATHRQRVARH